MTKKEMNYSIELDAINMSLRYNETQSGAFKNHSEDTRPLSLEFLNL